MFYLSKSCFSFEIHFILVSLLKYVSSVFGQPNVSNGRVVTQEVDRPITLMSNGTAAVQPVSALAPPSQPASGPGLSAAGNAPLAAATVMAADTAVTPPEETSEEEHQGLEKPSDEGPKEAEKPTEEEPTEAEQPPEEERRPAEEVEAGPAAEAWAKSEGGRGPDQLDSGLFREDDGQKADFSKRAQQLLAGIGAGRPLAKSSETTPLSPHSTEDPKAAKKVSFGQEPESEGGTAPVVWNPVFEEEVAFHQLYKSSSAGFSFSLFQLTQVI